MNTIKKTIVGIASSVALVSAIALGPVAASASASGPDGNVSGPPVAAQTTPTSAPTTSTPTTVVRTASTDPTAPPGGDGINRSIPGLEGPGKPPLIEYDRNGFMTQDSARRLLAAGWRATDGSELEEIASGNHGGPGSGGDLQKKPAPGAGAPGTGAPRTGTSGTGTLPRVAG